VADKIAQVDTTTKCPFCGKVNPEIRRIVSYVNARGITVIYSCGHCKRIINLETILYGSDPLGPDKETMDKEPEEKKAA